MNIGLDNEFSVYQYEVLRYRLYSVIECLIESIDSLSDLDGVLENKFCIDDSSIELIKIKEINEILKSRVSYLNNNVIPSINSKINSLK